MAHIQTRIHIPILQAQAKIAPPQVRPRTNGHQTGRVILVRGRFGGLAHSLGRSRSITHRGPKLSREDQSVSCATRDLLLSMAFNVKIFWALFCSNYYLKSPWSLVSRLFDALFVRPSRSLPSLSYSSLLLLLYALSVFCNFPEQPYVYPG